MKSNLPYNVMVNTNDWANVPRDPVTISAAVFGSTFGATATAIFITTLAISTVTSWALQALAPSPDNSGNRGLLTNIREAAAPHDYVYGKVRKGGVITYLESTGDNNKFLHQIIVLAGHEVDAINDIYINDEVVTIDGATGNVTDDVYSSITYERVEDGVVEGGRGEGQPKYVTNEIVSSKLRIQKFLGNQTTAPADLLAETENTSLDANFVGNDIAYLYVRYEYDQEVFANGIPLVTAEVQGKKVEDPRTSSTSYSANAALCIRDYLISDYGMDDAGSTNDTVFSANANICDEDVDLATSGVQPRYEINGVISSSDTPANILQSMMASCAGSLFWGQGKWQLRVGYYTAPVKTFTLDDLRSPIDLSTRVSRRDNFNIVRGTFNNADDRYITQDYPEIKGTAFITEDNGLENALDLTFPLTTSSAMAQRLAKLTLFRGREQMTFKADFSMAAFDVQVGDIVAITNARYGWLDKEFEVKDWMFFADDQAGDLKVSLTLQETSEAAFDWDAEESAIINNNTNLPLYNVGTAITGLAASGGGELQTDGTFVNSVIVSWDNAKNSFTSHYEVEYRQLNELNSSTTTTSETSIELSPLIDGFEYVISVRSVSVAGYRGVFSNVLFTGGGDVTAPNDPTSFTSVGSMGFINLAWVNPADLDFNFTEVWESADANLNSATMIAKAFGDTYNRGNLAPLTTRYHWIRSVDFSSNKSAFVGPLNSATTEVTATDIGPAVINYDNFATDVTDVFDGIATDISERVLTSDYNITVGYQQQLEHATTQLATDALALALNSSELESRINDSGITVDPDTGSVTIQGLSAIDDRVNTVVVDLDAVEGELTLKATTSYVDSSIAAATLPEATVAELESLKAQVNTVEVDLNSVEATLTLSSTSSLYDVNDGVLGVEALEGRITVSEGDIVLKASQTGLDDVDTRLSSAEVAINSLDVPAITLSVQDVRAVSNKQKDLANLNLKEVLGRYNDREYLIQDAAYARQSLTADVNEQNEAFASLTTDLSASIGVNTSSILSEQVARANADSALSEDITQLESTVVDLDADVVGNATAVSSLDTRVSSAEGSITSQASSLTDLESNLSTTDGLVSGNATAISGLDTRVGNAEGTISSQSTSITNLESDLSTAEGLVSGNATAISGLDTRVSSAEGDITSQASSLNSLSTTVGDNTTSVNQAATSINGIEGKYGVSIDNNNIISGFQLLSGVGGSAFNVRADQFNVFDANASGGATPFSVFTSSRTVDGVVYPAGTYIKDAFIDDAAIVNGSITNAKIGGDIQSDNFSTGSTGWKISKTGSAEFNGVVISRQLEADSGSFYIGNVGGSSSATPVEKTPVYIETNINVSAWGGTSKTYLVAVSNSGAVTAATSDVNTHPTTIRWGFRGDIVPLTQWSGGAKLWIKVTPTVSRVQSTDLTIQWKMYEVT